MFKRYKKRDLPFEIDDDQIRALIKLANFHANDIFYDVGCARGRVVIMVAKEAKVKKAIGIESERDLYQRAREAASVELAHEELRMVDFWYGDSEAGGLDDKQFLYEMCDATVVYYGFDETDDMLSNLKARFGKNDRVKFLTKHLPFVGYASSVNRDNHSCWFYLTRNPPKRIRNKRQWAGSVLDKEEASISDVYDYYSGQLKKQYPEDRDRKYRLSSLLSLKMLVNDRFG